VLDAVIRNGDLVDGTGAPPRRADVGIRDGRVVAIGDVEEPATRVVDADGLAVVPGFVDLHAHYDAQVLWDPTLSPSPLHGVTTLIAGNCGLTLAPVEPDGEDFLVRMLASVEGMPAAALAAGVEFRWRSFAEYLAAVDKPLAANLGFMVGHSAIRRAVMGARGSAEPASAADLAAMRRLLSQAIAAGGFGFSTSNVHTQRDGDGRPTPPNFASREEMTALAAVTGEHPGTCIEFIPDSFLVGFSDADVRLMAEMSAAANRHLNWNVVLVNKAAPDLYRRQLRASDAAQALGGLVVPMTNPQSAPNQQELVQGYVFRALPGWGWLFELDLDERIAALARPETRARLKASLDAAEAGLAVSMRSAWGEYFVNEIAGDSLQHLVGRRIAEIARERSVSELDAFFDVAVAARLEVGFVRMTYTDDPWTNAARAEVLADPRVVLGASDAGAHGDMMVGADFPSRSLAELVRERGVLRFEELVRRLTDVPARLYGLRDRGRIVPGAFADLVLLDPRTVGATPMRTVRDLPGGAKRLMTRSIGIDRVLVAGREVVVGGRFTGDLPGRLLRSGRDSITVPARAA
jgi:N-acyl-D-aspartate/D-glutamate deacylase